jgi:hypothetical protein
MRITRRLDNPGQSCVGDVNCPAVFSTSTGDVAFIGRTASPEMRESLPVGSGLGEGEELVVVPREVLINAGWNPPGA